MTLLLAIPIALELVVNTIGGGDGLLEPSVQNEVDHSISLAKQWLEKQPKPVQSPISCTNCCSCACSAAKPPPAPTAEDLFRTNGLTREAIALKLISSQRSGGYWITSTNDVPTRTAVTILESL